MRRLLVMAATLSLLAACTATDPTTTTAAGSAEIPSTTTTSTTVLKLAPEPVTSIVDSGEGGADFVGHMPVIMIPPDGLPFVVYLSHDGAEEGSEDWVFNASKCSDPTCSGDTTVTAFDIRNWGQPPSVTLGPDGLPVVVYLDGESEEEGRQRTTEDPSSPPDDRLHLVRCLDPACDQHTNTALGPGQSASVVVPADGLPLVSYNELDGNQTMLRKCSNAGCSSSTVAMLEGAGVCSTVPLLLDPTGMPMVAFARNEPLTEETAGQPRPGFITVAYCDDFACAEPGDLIAVAEVDQNPAMIGCGMGPDGPVFAMATHNTYEVMRCLDRDCSNVASGSWIGPPRSRGPGSMAVDAGGVPVLAYGTDDGLVLARCDDLDCAEGTMAILDHGWIFDLSVTINPAGNPVIAYYAPPELKVVTCVDPGCIEGAIDVSTWDQETSVVAPQEPVGDVMEGWMAVADPDRILGLGGGGGLRQVLTTGTGLLALGQTCEIEEGQTGECSYRVWASSDGMSWEQVADFGAADVWTTVAGGPGFVAFGGTCGSGFSTPSPDCGPAVWTSADGLEWSRVPHDEDVFPSCLQVDDPFCMLSVEGGAVLPAGDLLAYGYSSAGLTFWVSPDGLTWSRTDEMLLPFGPDLGSWWVDEIFTFDHTVIATGEACREVEVAYLGASLDPSEDGFGMVVSRVETNTAAEEAGLQAGDVIIVFDGEPVVDNAQKLITAREPGSAVTLTVLRDGEETSMTATLGSYEDFFCSALLATSPDGAVWTPVEGVLESDGDSWHGHFTKWSGGLLSMGEICDISYNCETLLVTSPDGVTWETQSLSETLAGVSLNRVFPFGDGLLGTGFKFDEMSGDDQGVLAVSSDGAAWTLYATDPDVFQQHAGINDLVEWNGRLIAVGSAMGPTVWTYEPPE